MKCVNFAIVIHNHQPVGNLEHVMDEAYHSSYLPLLQVLSEFPDVPFSMHVSGVLLEWLIDNHPQYVEMAADAVSRGQMEVVGGTFGEAILTMVPRDDALGQIAAMNELVEKTFGVRPAGFWLTERVWEQSLVSLLAEADRGLMLKVFPGNERLRYLVPFREVDEAVQFLKEQITSHGQRIVIYADDGEKFGLWPGTHARVFKDEWLRRFLSALSENSEWLKLTTCGRAAVEFEPVGLVAIPDASYREMMEWALPTESRSAMTGFVRSLKSAGLYEAGKFFIRGGIWRNFHCKYPEARQMYGKMMYVSRKVNRMPPGPERDAALAHLYRGQCNCPYWHGIFGGLYLPHLRNAAFRQLILAEVLADRHGPDSRVRPSPAALDVVDIDFDGQEEVVLADDKVSAAFKPSYGGHLFELDIRPKAFNCLATLTRRRESYHDVIENPPEPDAGDVASIHDRVAFKAEGLEELLQYDWYRREAFIDHFLPAHVTLEAFARAQYAEFGDFVNMPYTWESVTVEGHPGIRMGRAGGIWRQEERTPVRLAKTFTLSNRRCGLDADYEITNASGETLSVNFAVEFNFAMLAGSAEDRFYHTGDADHALGDLSACLDMADVGVFCIHDGWQGLDISISTDKPGRVWTFPVKTVSRSESGFEPLYQSSAVAMLWPLSLAPDGTWRAKLSVVATA